MRTFVALALPEEVRDALEGVQAGLRHGRLVPGENMHVTLAFLDDQPEDRLEALHERLAGTDLPAPELRITGLETFGGTRPRLIVATVEKARALTKLREEVRGAAWLSDIDLPRERFRPHVTLARLPRHLPAAAAPEIATVLEAQGAFRLPPFTPPHLGLYASRLTPDGSIYSELATYPLVRSP